MSTTIAPAEPEAGPPPPARRGVGALMFALAALFVVVAIVLVVVGVNARSDASHDDDRTAALSAATRASAAKQRTIDHQREEIRALANTVTARANTLNTAFNDMVEAQNAFIDVVNRAAAADSSGNRAGVASAFQGDGAAALATMVEKNAAVQQAVAALNSALTRLEAAK